MISYLKGILAAKNNAGIILEVGGIGFEIFMPLTSLSDIGSVGEHITVQTYLHVRENEFTFYGFSQPSQRELFLRLIEVNGVGPKVALAALSSLDSDTLVAAIVSEDYATIASIPGVGKKTAQRIALDLKDKFSQYRTPDGAQFSSHISEQGSAFGDARLALESMGFSPLEVSRALQGAQAQDDVSSLIEKALKKLAQ